MDGEPSFRRFLSVVIAFLGSMVTLIFINTLFGALIGWDGLGITSFLLVIYFKNRKSLSRGMVTALTNRLGDAFLLVLLGLAFLPITATYVLLVLLLLTAITKSAQYPFSSWLPAAMAAPTPVRALVHSSTLVTAGVYLLLRFNHNGTEWLLAFGSITMLLAGLCACTEKDIKKIVALRTLSQLGVMMVGIGLALKSLRFFHLLTHAMFKALLFLCVGVGIHTVFGTQDKRRYSSVTTVLPLPRALLSVGVMALRGVPFLAGFYRKDAILESFYSASQRLFLYVIFLYGVGLTAAYGFGLILGLGKSARHPLPATLNGGGTPPSVKGPLLALGLGAILGGYLLAPFLSLGGGIIAEADKLFPLVIILKGMVLHRGIKYEKLPHLRRLWGLNPSYQHLAATGVGLRTASLVDAGAGEALIGPGWLGLFIGSQLSFYPVLTLALLATLLAFV